MDNECEKKKRAPNFSPSEKCLLLNIILNFKHIIENKKTDSCTWKEKDEAWKKISVIFNSKTTDNCHRNKDALRKYYDNIKKKIKKDVAEEKKEIYVTGGGVKRKICGDDSTQLALSIMNEKTLYGFSNPFDGDADVSAERISPQDHSEEVNNVKPREKSCSEIYVSSDFQNDSNI